MEGTPYEYCTAASENRNIYTVEGALNHFLPKYFVNLHLQGFLHGESTADEDDKDTPWPYSISSTTPSPSNPYDFLHRPQRLTLTQRGR